MAHLSALSRSDPQVQRYLDPFRQERRELGYVEGQRFAPSQLDQEIGNLYVAHQGMIANFRIARTRAVRARQQSSSNKRVLRQEETTDGQQQALGRHLGHLTGAE